mgnify:CR=1 FL=1
MATRFQTSPAPHVIAGFTVPRVMFQVLLALVPVVLVQVAVFASGLVLLVLGVGITSLSSTTGFLWLSAIGFLLMFGGAVLAVASVGPIRKARPAAPGKPHRR